MQRFLACEETFVRSSFCPEVAKAKCGGFLVTLGISNEVSKNEDPTTQITIIGRCIKIIKSSKSSKSDERKSFEGLLIKRGSLICQI